MKSIAIFIPSLLPGGAEKQATILATILDKKHKVEIYLLHGESSIAPQNQELLTNSNVSITRLQGNIFSKIYKFRKLLKEKNTDILLNYLTSCNVIGAIIGRLAGVKLIYGGIRNARIETSKMIIDKIAHNFISTGTIYNCYSGAEYFTSKGFNEKKNIVIPNGFPNIAEPIVRDDREVKHIVTTGRFVPQKDYHTMIQVIAKLKESRTDFVMDIIGYGVEEENIRSWIAQYGVEDITNIFIKPDNVQEIVRNADIYLSTSIFEGTSNSIMEALNWSLPVVATDVGDNKHLVEDGRNGNIHSFGDAEGMANSLLKLLDSVELRNNFGAYSHKLLKNNFSLDVFEERYTKVVSQQ
ncbi:MAG: glycosyltransferase [Alistipes sp.]|nr:glycosyltransferase [Alistipes sp.]